MKFKIGQEVAFDMNCPCGECDSRQEKGYIIHVINGKETKDFLKRCFIFSKETMKRLK